MILRFTLHLTGFLILSLSQSRAVANDDVMDYAALSCQQLYVLASQLEPATQHYRSPLFNEKTNVIATAIGSVSTIGYYYFGFSIGRDYYEDYRRHQKLGHLDQIRQYMAHKYCFQKF